MVESNSKILAKSKPERIAQHRESAPGRRSAVDALDADVVPGVVITGDRDGRVFRARLHCQLILLPRDGHLKRERYRRRGIRPNKRMTIID